MPPITPAEAFKKREELIPEFVYTAINNLITKEYKHKNVSFDLYKRKIINEIIAIGNVTEEEIYENGWLDFESVYSKYGWQVIYEAPDWGEVIHRFYRFKAL